MLFTVLFSLIATITATFAHVLNSDSTSQNLKKEDCSLELQGIIYNPENCGFSYLKSISLQLTIKAPLLFSPTQAQSVIDAFAATYNVVVALTDAMGNIVYSSVDTSSLPTGSYLTSSLARAMALGEGFVSGSYTFLTPGKSINAVAPVISFISYKYLLWNVDGKLFIVSVFLNKANSPVFC